MTHYNQKYQSLGCKLFEYRTSL